MTYVFDGPLDRARAGFAAGMYDAGRARAHVGDGEPVAFVLDYDPAGRMSSALDYLRGAVLVLGVERVVVLGRPEFVEAARRVGIATEAPRQPKRRKPKAEPEVEADE